MKAPKPTKEKKAPKAKKEAKPKVSRAGLQEESAGVSGPLMTCTCQRAQDVSRVPAPSPPLSPRTHAQPQCAATHPPPSRASSTHPCRRCRPPPRPRRPLPRSERPQCFCTLALAPGLGTVLNRVCLRHALWHSQRVWMAGQVVKARGRCVYSMSCCANCRAHDGSIHTLEAHGVVGCG